MTPLDCLPEPLRRPETTLTRIAAGLSGAEVYRVDADGQSFVLKRATSDQPVSDWLRQVRYQQLAGQSQLAPTVIHVEEKQRAVLSTFLVDRAFPAFIGPPATRPAALRLLGKTLRDVHALPITEGHPGTDVRAFLVQVQTSLSGALPIFAADAVQRVLDETPPDSGRAPVLSHNDVNPTNLVFDGERLRLLDWDHAGPNEPYFDLATAAVFFRLNDADSVALLSAYEERAVSALPERLRFDCRLVAALCGAMMLRVASRGDPAVRTSDEQLETTLGLGDFYQRVRSGAESFATHEGQRRFGLALLKESLSR